MTRPQPDDSRWPPRFEPPPTRDDVIHSDPEIMSAVPVFRGARVPADTLFHYLT